MIPPVWRTLTGPPLVLPNHNLWRGIGLGESAALFRHQPSGMRIGRARFGWHSENRVILLMKSNRICRRPELASAWRIIKPDLDGPWFRLGGLTCIHPARTAIPG